MNVETRYAIHPRHAAVLDTQDLRDEFLVQSLFIGNIVTMTYSHIDRICVGGVMPIDGTTSLPHSLGEKFGVAYFLERREMGIINIGMGGTITVDGKHYTLGKYDALYIGKGAVEVSFKSLDPKNPAKFYYTSVPAHASYPTTFVHAEKAISAELGSVEDCNARTIHKYFVPEVLETCQLCMGMTNLKTGSNWNSMPPHTHERRMEVYFYFDVEKEHRVFHMMGEPQETRHIVVANEQAIISPPWSMHSGVGTKAYSFIWSMSGENQTFDDMDQLKVKDLR